MNREASLRLTRNGKTPPFQCEQGETELLPLRCPFHILRFITLALSAENDLNSVAMFEDV